MTPPIALQLYTLRELITKDGFETVVRQVAQIGYHGVETDDFPRTTPQKAAKLFKELNLVVPAIHHDFPTPERTQEVIDVLGALDCTRIVSGFGREQFKSVDGIRKAAEQANQAWERLAPHGVELLMHNHWWEYLPFGGSLAYEVWMEFLSPKILFEVDTYWVKTAGADPAMVVKQLGARTPLLHIKDGPAVRDRSMTAVGEGVLDVPGIIQAGKDHTQWLIVEIDRCDSDMLEAVRKSYLYLKSILDESHPHQP